MIYDVLIIGAGVIGGMAARELSRYQLSVCLLEKENDVACGATRANSGIIHGGYDPEPGTLKATLNTAGVSMLYEAARQLHVPHVNNGSLVCAFSQEEDAAVWELYDRGIVNGISGLKVLTGDEARILEPELSGAVTSALHIPTAGIICPYELTIAAVGNAIGIQNLGARIGTCYQTVFQNFRDFQTKPQRQRVSDFHRSAPLLFLVHISDDKLSNRNLFSRSVNEIHIIEVEEVPLSHRMGNRMDRTYNGTI